MAARRRFLEAAIDRGSFRALVVAASSGEGIEKALFQLFVDLRDLENNRTIIQEWTRSFERVHHDLHLVAEPEETTLRPQQYGATGRQAFERAMQQQNAIVDRMRAADFDTARRYARDLVADQRRSSAPEHIAMSLSSISQKAKDLAVIELALEWAQQAIEAKPDDPLAHAQYADLLMRVGRFTEAHQSLDLAQSFGEAGFAASGRARILRYQGQFPEALEAYQRASVRYSSQDERLHFDLAGIAECLRDMEELDKALQAYDDAIARFPYIAALHSGRAATLVDLGRYDEALNGYQTARNLDDHNVVPRNGIASLYRRAGEFERAEVESRSIIAEYPFDVHARGILVGTLRDLGRFSEAIAEARNLAATVPASPDSLWILADALIDGGEFEAAAETLKSAIEDFRHVAGLRAGLARIERAKGHYAAALALFDDAARDFPSNSWLQLGRADMLRRLGNVDEALLIYERTLKRHPHRLAVKNALASIYIHQRRFDEALALLDVDDPRSADEWRNFALHGMLDQATGYEAAAHDRFVWGTARCPFRRERRFLRAALSRLQLQTGRTELAVETAQECAGDVTEIVKFHATAALSDKASAKALYERLLQSCLPEPYHELRDEIARIYQVIASPPRRTLDWVAANENDALLLEAA